MSVLDMFSGELAPTAAYKRRWWHWRPGDDPTTGVECDGVLTVGMQKGVRPGSKIEEDHYAVQEVECVGRPGRAFFLLNIFDDEQPDVYQARLFADGVTDCTCTAGQCRVPGTPQVSAGCKHRDALAEVIAAGGLDRAAPSAGAHAPANSAH